MSRQFRPNSGPVVGAEVATGHGAVGGEFDCRAVLRRDVPPGLPIGNGPLHDAANGRQCGLASGNANSAL